MGALALTAPALEADDLTAEPFVAVHQLLAARELLLQAGMKVDATILSAPSTKECHKRMPRGRATPRSHRLRKGHTRLFGMKVHAGDCRGIMHSLVTTDAAQADITPPVAPVARRRDRALWRSGVLL